MEVFGGCFRGHQDKRNRLTQDVWSLRQRMHQTTVITKNQEEEITHFTTIKSNTKAKPSPQMSRDYSDHSKDSTDSGLPLLHNHRHVYRNKYSSTDGSELSTGSSQSKSGTNDQINNRFYI